MPEDQSVVRKEKLEYLKQHDIAPYGGRFSKTESISATVNAYEEGRVITTAGRLTAKRAHGALTFADVRDATGKIQVCLKQERVGDNPYTIFGQLDLGDIVGVEGTLFRTKTSEVTIQVDKWTLLAKALHPLPEKWHGLQNQELRYRRRYLDLIANPEARDVFLKRSQILSDIRGYLDRRGFVEVETPMMHPIAGGAAGEPFKTHHNALGTDLYLRIAPELYLKRLLVGGLDKVYEINRSFRNEGLSTRHNPEFTMLEVYEAYGNCASMMELTESLIKALAEKTLGTLEIPYGDRVINLAGRWPRMSFADMAHDKFGIEACDSLEMMVRKLVEHKVIPAKQFQDAVDATEGPAAKPREVDITEAGIAKHVSKNQLAKLVQQSLDKISPDNNKTPTFVTDFFEVFSPLAKSVPDRPGVADRFELFLGGMELANAYSELNDPIEQRRRFKAQKQIDGKKAQRIDEDFLEALEYGMPPAGGLGIGIDRLVMLLLNKSTIRDVILFPLLKTESSDD